MEQSVIDRVLEEIKGLQPEELIQVNRAVNGLLHQDPKEMEREQALRVLENSGLVREIKRPLIAARPCRLPVPIQGKPLSETIVEDRR